MIRSLLACVLVSCLMVASGEAGYLELAPSQSTILAADESGNTDVAFHFDLAVLPETEGLKIHMAILDWEAPGMPSDAHSEYTIHTVTESWSAASAGTGTRPSFQTEATDLWEYEARDSQRNDGGLIRFNVRDLVITWNASGGNYGVVIRSSSLDSEAILGSLGTARLKVWFE